MIKNIRYNGYTAQPSDYDAPDGDLAVALNLINENNSLHPACSPHKVLRLPINGTTNDAAKILCVHELSDGTTLYIINTTFKFQDEKELDVLTAKNADTDESFTINVALEYRVKSVKALGNILSIYSDDISRPVDYALWRDGAYIFLGSQPPFIPIEFALRSYNFDTDYQADTVTVRFEDFESRHLVEEMLGIPFTDLSPIREQDLQKLAQGYHAIVNRTIARAAKNGAICYPVLIRYAIKLFDGNYINYSSPQLLLPASVPALVAYSYKEDSAGEFLPITFTLQVDMDPYNSGIAYKRGLNPCLIQFRLLDHETKSLSLWKDLIQSVDVFITPQMYQYSNDDLVKIARIEDGDRHFFGNFNPHIDTNTYLEDFLDRPIGIYNRMIMPDADTKNNLQNCIKNASNFYKIASISFDDIKPTNTFSDLKLDYTDIRNIVTRQTLPDFFVSSASIHPEHAYIYNSRIHYASIIRTPDKPRPLRTLVPYSYIEEGKQPASLSSFVLLRKNGSIVYTYLEEDHVLTSCPRFIFYPDPDAYMYCVKSDDKYFLFPLKPHDFLNGAFWLDEDMQASKINVEPITDFEIPNHSTYYPESNIVYVSDVNNPFYFDAESVIEVNAGKILAVASAARALSQGQFGQFPLYIFTDKGIWAAQIASNGKYSARQPISRDVCINPNAITSIDSAVIFPSDRGIMIISGSELSPISELIKTEYPFQLSSLPMLKNAMQKMYPDINLNAIELLEFSDFLRSSNTIYDYKNQRLLFYSTSANYSYVYSFLSKEWSFIHSNIKYKVDSYPEALAVILCDDGEYLVDYSSLDSRGKISPAILITRPLKLDGPDILKTIDTVIQRGNFAKGHVASVLYGSRDLIHWHLIWSSQSHIMRGFSGTPYKYFRIALICNLDPDESISGASIQFTPRYGNKLR